METLDPDTIKLVEVFPNKGSRHHTGDLFMEYFEAELVRVYARKISLAE